MGAWTQQALATPAPRTSSLRGPDCTFLLFGPRRLWVSMAAARKKDYTVSKREQKLYGRQGSSGPTKR